MSHLETIWQTSFNKAVGAQQEKNDTNPVDWRAGGRASKEWPDKENGDWWNKNGLKMFQDFAEMWAVSGMQVWTTPEGIPGLELEINQYYGDVYVKAFVDCVAVTPEGELAVIDWKTGKSMPSSMQLGLYASGIEKQFGIRPTVGYYYDARKAIFTPANITRWTPALFTELFKQFETAVQNNIFLPNVGMSCASCSVADYCYANGGSMAEMFDNLYSIAIKKENQ